MSSERLRQIEHYKAVRDRINAAGKPEKLGADIIPFNRGTKGWVGLPDRNMPPPDQLNSHSAVHLRTNFNAALLAVSMVMRVPMPEIMMDVRVHRVVVARHLLYWLLKNETGYGWSEIGRRLNRDHTTVLHGCGLVQGRIDRGDSDTIKLIGMIKDRLVTLSRFTGYWGA